ncbi:MAG TPA: hypothetical protein VHU23_17345 [Rhizomicrobium sp.]|jgi:hypothetical protein|nr:hypothetical protein [Rhizomicrobium sp.]
MTPEQAHPLHALAIGAALLGVVETLMGVFFRQAQKAQTRNLSYMLMVAGPGFLIAAAILYWGGAGYPTIIGALVAIGIGSNIGVLRMARAAKKSAGNQFP